MRRWWALALAIPLLLAGALLPVLVPRSSPVTQAAYKRIDLGMTEAEVEAVLGGPPGSYQTRPVRIFIGSGAPSLQRTLGYPALRQASRSHPAELSIHCSRRGANGTWRWKVLSWSIRTMSIVLSGATR